MNPVYLFDHPVFRQHDAGVGHPERPERLDAIRRGIDSCGLRDRLEWVKPAAAAVEHLLRVHSRDHVEEMLALRGRTQGIDLDTQVSPSSIDAALMTSGACIQAVDQVLLHPGSSAFCLGRPPGHHAERNRAMGFCLFNHVAVAAAYAIAEKGLPRVMIIDPDVHHGNGTQDIFYERDDVCYFSMHQWPLFPGTGDTNEQGAGAGKGTTVNVPMPAGSGDREYLAIAEQKLLPLIASFKPELVIVSAGFDAHEDDPLAGMAMTSAGFVKFYAVVLAEVSRREIPVFLSLEGGYSLMALEETVPAVLEELLVTVR